MTNSRLAAFWYALRHTSKEIDWVPPWRRHRKPCREAFHRGYEALEAGDSATYRLETLGHSYCAHCDYIELRPSNLLWWLMRIPFAWRDSREEYR